jgi:hypothetical protein
MPSAAPDLIEALDRALPGIAAGYRLMLAQRICQVVAAVLGAPCEAGVRNAALSLYADIQDRVGYSAVVRALAVSRRVLRAPSIFAGDREQAQLAEEALRLISINLKRLNGVRRAERTEPFLQLGDLRQPYDAVGCSDAAVVDGRAGGGVLLTQTGGQELAAVSVPLPPLSPSAAEWAAFEHGLQLAVAFGVRSLLMQVDAASIPLRARHLQSPPRGLERLDVVRVSRLFTRRADRLAHAALNAELSS